MWLLSLHFRGLRNNICYFSHFNKLWLTLTYKLSPCGGIQKQLMSQACGGYGDQFQLSGRLHNQTPFTGVSSHCWIIFKQVWAIAMCAARSGVSMTMAYICSLFSAFLECFSVSAFVHFPSIFIFVFYLYMPYCWILCIIINERMNELCDCGEIQTMSHIVNSCPLTKFNKGLLSPLSPLPNSLFSLTHPSLHLPPLSPLPPFLFSLSFFPSPARSPRGAPEPKI